MQIHGLNKTTLLDYPGHVAATIFTGSCNFRCPFCYNKDLVLYPDRATPLPEEEVLTFLTKRRGVLTGICITGGEPTLQPDLAEFIRQVKALGYLVKLDTNGYKPQVVQALWEAHLIDYVAMDIKTSPNNYSSLTCVPDLDISKIQASVSFLMQCGIEYEFRTTVVKELHSSESLLALAAMIADCRAYYLQSYQESDNLANAPFNAYTEEELRQIAEALRPIVPNIFLRGIS